MELSRIFLACSVAAVSFAVSAVTVSGPGTYTLDAGTLAVGQTVTLTAVPDSGKAFFRWTGDIGNADPAEATITFKVPGDSIGVLFGNEIVVKADGTGDYPTLNAAVAAASDYDTIVLEDGQHTNATPAFVVIDKPVKLTSRNGRETTFFKSIKVPSDNKINVNPAYKGIQVNNSLVIVKDITFFNFGCDGVQTPRGLAVYLQQGLVEYCTVSNTLPNHGASALHMTGGETRHSLIAYNRSNNNQNAPGAGVYLEGGTITNCVIRGNRAWKNHGGGIYVNGATARVTGCVIDGNICDFDDDKPRYGGGVYLKSGVVDNCVITNNTAALAAGVCQVGGTFLNCLIKDNHSARSYGGVYSTGGAIEDCIIADNTAKVFGGQALCMTAGSISGTTAIGSLYTIPSQAIVSIAPDVTVSGCEFQCPNISGATEINASLFYATGDCYVEASRVVGLAPLAVAFTAHCLGDASAAVWDFGDGGTASGATASHTFAACGIHTVALTVGAESATLDIHVLPTDTYVSTTGSEEFPYDTWEKAAHDLQSAIDAAYADDNVAGTVHVAAGKYTYGGANRNGSNVPWFMVAKPVSVVGPEEGRALFDGSNNTRGMYLFHSQASLRNLTFYRCKNGQNGGPYIGGALYMTGGVVSNCTIISCHGNFDGAVTAEGGWLQDCYFGTNSCSPSGDDRRGAGLQIYGAATATGCVFEKNSGGYGGGASMHHASAVISNCVFRGNSASGCGGGGVTIDNGLLTHCVITNNTTSAAGGGLQLKNGTVRNSIIAFNKSTSTGSSYGNGYGKAGGGGVNINGGTVENCTFYGNTSSSQTRCDELLIGNGTVRNCIFVGTDVTPANDVYKRGGTATYCLFRTEVAGDGNITGDAKLKNPQAGRFELLYGSPCLDAGMAIAAVATDFAGAARPADGNNDGTAAWDIGAYEMDFAGQMIASFEADVTSGHGETTVTFTASVDGGTAPYTYRWTIGGTTYETSENTFTHTFSFGSHDVTLDIEDATGATLSEPVVRTGLVQIKSPVVYVSTTGSGVWPYDTWEKATADWTLAVGAVHATDAEPGRILVADGTYTRHDTDNFTVNLTLPIEFAGTNAACGAVFNGESTYHKIVCVNNAMAKVANLKFINVKGNYGDDQGGLWLYVGTVSNCVFSGGSANGAGMVRQEGGLLCDSVIKDNSAGDHSGGDRYGGGLYMRGGTAERITIQGCRDGTAGAVRLDGASAILRDSVIQGNYSETGGAVLLDKGLVENCIISNNTGKSIAGSLVTFAAGPGATVRGGTLRNCLVVDNRMTSANGSGGALHVVSGAAYNNTVWANTLYSGATNDIGQTGGTVANSIAGVFVPSGGTQTGNYIGFVPGFANLSVGDFSLTGDSPCLDIGDWTFWGETRGAARAAKDMAGNSRLCGRSVDAGCYECAARGLSLFFR
jgi:PKD repeat protein